MKKEMTRTQEMMMMKKMIAISKTREIMKQKPWRMQKRRRN